MDLRVGLVIVFLRRVLMDEFFSGDLIEVFVWSKELEEIGLFSMFTVLIV